MILRIAKVGKTHDQVSLLLAAEMGTICIYLQMFCKQIRVPTAQGKHGKWFLTKIPVRENPGYLEILPKHREFGLLKL